MAMDKVFTQFCIWGGLLGLLPICMSKTPTSPAEDDCDAATEKELLQSVGQVKQTVMGTSGSGGYSWPASAAVNAVKCLDIPGNNPYKGAKLSIWDCNDSPAQKFEWWDDYTLRYSANTNYCVDIAATNKCASGPAKGQQVCFEDGSKVQIWECHGKNNQQFAFAPDTETQYSGYIKARNGNFCIADTSKKYDNSASLTAQACGDKDYQLNIPALFGSQLRPLNVIGSENQTCMDAEANSVTNGAKMLVWDCLKQANGLLQANQMFKYEKDSTIRFTGYPNMCLDAQLQNFKEGGPIQVWTCNGGENQQWALQDNQIKVKSKPELCVGDVEKEFKKQAYMVLTPCSSSQGFNFRGTESMECPWTQGPNEKHYPTCGDGTSESMWYCVGTGHGQRLKCPKSMPKMCSKRSCGDNKDFCCSKTCESETKGVTRPC